MRALPLALTWLLVGAAPAETPIGKFQTWLAMKNAPVEFISGGVNIHVEALPCPVQPVGDSSCNVDKHNNQDVVTVSSSGRLPISVFTDPQGAYARIAVVRFNRNDLRPGVVIESQYGGSGGMMTAQLLVPTATGYQALAMNPRKDANLQGELADMPQDLSGDGNIDLTLEDGAFDSAFGCNACTPRPPRIFAVKEGKVVDESRDSALRGVFVKEMNRLAPLCLSDAPDRNGACAAYVANAARAGQFDMAWTAMLKHYQRDGVSSQQCSVPVSAWKTDDCPPDDLKQFPDALRAFLVAKGYLAG